MSSITGVQWRASLLLTVGVFFLALSHVVARGVHLEVPPVGLSFWRWMLAALFLLPFLLPDLNATCAVYRSNWRSYLLAGCLIAVATTLIMLALNFTTATNVAIIAATQPALTALLLRLLFGVAIGMLQVIGMLIAFAGVLLMISHGEWQLMVALQFNIGDVLALVSLLGFSGYSICIARMPQVLEGASGLFPIVAVCALVLLPWYLAESLLYRPVPINPTSIAAIVGIALFVSCFAMLLWNRGIQVLGANRATIFINLVPVFGTLLAIIFLGESFTRYHLSGMLMIGTGVCLVTLRNQEWAPQQR